MQGKTHVAGGVAAGVGYTVLVGAVDPASFFIGCVVGSMLPDIDHHNSRLGRIFFFISMFLTHRGLTHSLLFLALAAGLFQIVTWPPGLETGLLVGMTSHLILDSITKDGIKLFYPFNMDFRLPPGVSTGGVIEKAVFTALTAVVAYYGYEMYL